MGATNFYKVNADKYYVVMPFEQVDHEGEAIEGLPYDEWMYETLHEMFFHEKDAQMSLGDAMHFEFIEEQKSKHDNMRNYHATYLGSFSVTIKFNRHKEYIILYYHCFARAGYYDGACLDWEREINVNGHYIDELLYEDFISCSDFRYTERGRAKIMYNRIKETFNSYVESIIKHIYGIFNEISMPYIKISQASNGEATYSIDPDYKSKE